MHAQKMVEALTNEDGPKIDEDEESDVREFLEGEDEWKDMVGYALGEAIHWMESVAGERCWHDPLVMWLVQRFVEFRMM